MGKITRRKGLAAALTDWRRTCDTITTTFGYYFIFLCRWSLLWGDEIRDED